MRPEISFITSVTNKAVLPGRNRTYYGDDQHYVDLK